ERGLDDLLDALGADLGVDAEVDAADAVFALDPGAHGHDITGVGGDGLGHAGGGGGGGVVGRAGLEQRDDLGAAVAGLGDQLVDLLGREQVGERLAVHGGLAGHGHHGV